jgi:hypothetical protein
MMVLRVKILRGGAQSTEILTYVVATTVVSQKYMRLVLCPAGLQTRRESHCHAGRSENHPATEYASYLWDNTLPMDTFIVS